MKSATKLLSASTGGDILASTVVGRLHRVVISITYVATSVCLAEVRQTGGADSGAVICFAGIKTSAVVGDHTWTFDFGPSGVYLPAGLRLLPTQTTANSDVYVTAMYEDA